MRVPCSVSILALVAMTGCGQSPVSPTPPASVRTTSSPASLSSNASSVVSIPVAFTVQASGKAAIQACVGEAVSFEGSARLGLHQTILPDGSVVLDQLHINPQGARAIGASSGTEYRLVGGDSNEVVTAPSGTLTATFVADLIVIGPGEARSFVAHILQHITILPDGTITALSDVFSADCR
jgi:hypothetical protein